MFPDVDPWGLALWAVAAYLAVVSLVRLMVFHRDRLVVRFRAQIEAERRRQAEFVLARKRHAAAANAKPAGRDPAG